MKWYPFATRWLKASQNRDVLHQSLLDITFLSDAGYSNADNKKKFFFGAVNDREFKLESIDKDKKLAAFVTGEILGVENETYIRLKFGAFKHQRLFIMLLLFTLCGIALFVQGALQNQSEQSFVYLSAMGSVISILFIYLLAAIVSFSKKLRYSTDFFRGLYEAELIEEIEVPSVFLL